MLRSNAARVSKEAGFKKMLPILCRHGYVKRLKKIYIFTVQGARPDLVAYDSLMNSRHGQWFKMRTVIDNAPQYDLSGHPETQSAPHEST